jgi:prepilin-type N-terminal cleavage/methylation domain-containing protein
MKQKKQSGFTLVELAIVLVIIGLIVGGVLVGQDLIKAAENNAAIQQFEKTDAAVNTFRTKYNGIPGDLLNPANFGLASSNAGTAGRADGDGVIETAGAAGCSNAFGLGGESALFWNHLAFVQLIGGTFAISDYTADAAITSIGDSHLPQSKFGKGNRLHITNVAGRNVYVVSNITATTATTCALTGQDGLTPLQASNVDVKKDDGNASTGIVVSVAAADPSALAGGAGTPAAGDCYDSDTGAFATTSEDLSNALGCQLRIRTSF